LSLCLHLTVTLFLPLPLHPVGYGGTNQEPRYPYPATHFTADWPLYPERILLFLLVDTASPLVRTLLVRFVDVYLRQLRDMVLGRYFIRGDQTAFREALYYFRESVRERRELPLGPLVCHRMWRYNESCVLYHASDSVARCMGSRGE
jgi:hypothetical protein